MLLFTVQHVLELELELELEFEFELELELECAWPYSRHIVPTRIEKRDLRVLGPPDVPCGLF